MSELKKLVLNGQEYTFTDTGAVVFDEAQALTESQKAQARQNIGAAKQADYGLIETVTLDTAARLDRSQEPDGTPYNFDALFFHILIPAGATVTEGSFMFYGASQHESFAHRWTAGKTANTNQLVYHGRVYRSNGLWCWYLPGDFSKHASSPMVYDELRANVSDMVNEDKITRIWFTQTFPAGTVIKIYGVRA